MAIEYELKHLMINCVYFFRNNTTNWFLPVGDISRFTKLRIPYPICIVISRRYSEALFTIESTLSNQKFRKL